MAEGVKDGFISWLSSYLSERSIDLDVYLDYISGIAYASGEGDEEELISSLEEVLSGAVVSGYANLYFVWYEIFCSYCILSNLMYVRSYV